MILIGEQEKTGNMELLLESLEHRGVLLMELCWIPSHRVFKIGKISSLRYYHLNSIKKKNSFKSEIQFIEFIKMNE